MHKLAKLLLIMVILCCTTGVSAKNRAQILKSGSLGAVYINAGRIFNLYLDQARELLKPENAEELEKISINIPVQVGEEDRLFGSVTSQMIADALKEKNFDIDKRKIELEDQIKTLGIFDVNIKLHSKVSAKIKVWVVRE